MRASLEQVLPLEQQQVHLPEVLLIQEHRQQRKQHLHARHWPCLLYTSGSVRVAKNRFQSEDFEKQLLYVEGGKQVSDIGIVIRVENFDELQLLESIEIIWDYDMATTTLLYVPTFMPPKRKSNCYLLQAEIRDELEESRLEIGKTRIIRNNGNTQISLRERQTNGKDHFIHYITTELSASPLGENIRIAGASKKYMKWQKRRLKEE